MSDFEDAIEDISVKGDNDQEKRPKTNKNGLKVRGKAKNWHQVMNFSDQEVFKNSEIGKTLNLDFSKRRSRMFQIGLVDHYLCKYARKSGFRPCPLQYKVTFCSSSLEVIVECSDMNKSHVHDVLETDEHECTLFHHLTRKQSLGRIFLISFFRRKFPIISS